MAVGLPYYGSRAVILWQPYICYNIASLRTAWMRGNRIDECTSSRQGWKRIPRSRPPRTIYGMMREPATQLGWREMRKGAARSMSGQPDGDAFGDATPTRRAGNSPPAQRSSNPRQTKEPGRPNKEKKEDGIMRRGHKKVALVGRLLDKGYVKAVSYSAISFTAAMAVSISSSVVKAPMLKRTVPWRSKVPMPMCTLGAHCRPVRQAIS